jgi:hypothetical protein
VKALSFPRQSLSLDFFPNVTVHTESGGSDAAQMKLPVSCGVFVLVEVGRFIRTGALPRQPLCEVDSSCECARLVRFLRFGLESGVSTAFCASLSAFPEVKEWAMALYLA